MAHLWVWYSSSPHSFFCFNKNSFLCKNQFQTFDVLEPRRFPWMIFFSENLIQLKMNCVLPLNLFHPFLLPNIHKYLFKILLHPPPGDITTKCKWREMSSRRWDECYCLERNVSCPVSIDTKQNSILSSSENLLIYLSVFTVYTKWNIYFHVEDE